MSIFLCIFGSTASGEKSDTQEIECTTFGNFQDNENDCSNIPRNFNTGNNHLSRRVNGYSPFQDKLTDSFGSRYHSFQSEKSNKTVRFRENCNNVDEQERIQKDIEKERTSKFFLFVVLCLDRLMFLMFVVLNSLILAL